jgi:hypothetical protein
MENDRLWLCSGLDRERNGWQSTIGCGKRSDGCMEMIPMTRIFSITQQFVVNSTFLSLL